MGMHDSYVEFFFSFSIPRPIPIKMSKPVMQFLQSHRGSYTGFKHGSWEFVRQLFSSWVCEQNSGDVMIPSLCRWNLVSLSPVMLKFHPNRLNERWPSGLNCWLELISKLQRILLYKSHSGTLIFKKDRFCSTFNESSRKVLQFSFICSSTLVSIQNVPWACSR